MLASFIKLPIEGHLGSSRKLPLLCGSCFRYVGVSCLQYRSQLSRNIQSDRAAVRKFSDVAGVFLFCARLWFDDLQMQFYPFLLRALIKTTTNKVDLFNTQLN